MKTSTFSRSEKLTLRYTSHKTSHSDELTLTHKRVNAHVYVLNENVTFLISLFLTPGNHKTKAIGLLWDAD